MRWTFFYEADFAGELSLSVYIFLIISALKEKHRVYACCSNFVTSVKICNASDIFLGS